MLDIGVCLLLLFLYRSMGAGLDGQALSKSVRAEAGQDG